MREIFRLYEPGEKIGSYTILSRLARWVEYPCRVYLAEHELLGRKAEIRLLLESDETLVNEWRQTAKLMAMLGHPNIPTLYDVGEHDGHPYLALEHVEGGSLFRFFRLSERVSILVALRIMAAIAGALHHAHEKGAIHKNIEPHNVLIGPTGNPFLCGFWAPAPSSASFLGGRAFLGSPYYASPEQARGESDTVQTNIWNFGAMLYHLAAGKRLHEGEKYENALDEIATPAPIELSPLEGRTPEYVAAIVGKCLRKDPDERYRTADEIRRALEVAIDHTEATESDTIRLAPPQQGQTLLLHVEYEEADLPGHYREYEIGPHMGGGVFGDVFRAKENLSGKTFALKILKREWLSDPEAVARFRREATLLSRLSHPNIVRVHNFGRYGESFFMAMDLLEGETLEEVINKRGPMEAHEALAVIIPVLSGLAAVHQTGAVHRDVKPGNIKVLGDRVVVFDFGIAHVGDMTKLTVSGEFLGTPGYASPEQARGRLPTSASDVYAAGVILYEMLTGRLPHEDESTYGLLQKIASKPPRPITRRRDLPEAIPAILNRMLAKDPAERPSAGEAGRMLLLQS